MNLTLYIPGLFGPEAQFSQEFIPRVDALEFLLARGSRGSVQHRSYHATLCHLFGFEPPTDTDIPVAAITRLIDADEHSSGCWMRADPVHLRADRYGLILLDARALKLDIRDALALAADLREILARENWRLEVPHPERWYLQMNAVPSLRTRELDAVVGRDIAPALPSGADAPRWHALMNEIQMRLHASDVNRARAAHGHLPVNSLWLWGIGELPRVIAPRWWKVYAEEISARAMARLASTPSAPLPSGPAEIAGAAPKAAPILAISNACKLRVEYQDLEGWHDSVCDLEEIWFQPCLRLLRGGILRSLDLITDRIRISVTRAALYRFWRRARPLAAHVRGI